MVHQHKITYPVPHGVPNLQKNNVLFWDPNLQKQNLKLTRKKIIVLVPEHRGSGEVLIINHFPWVMIAQHMQGHVSSSYAVLEMLFFSWRDQ